MYQDMSGAEGRHGLVDLRSDTVTLPSPAMREAIERADLGDDVYGEDPTVNRLERLAAELVGKEAAVLVPTGTMGNLSAVLAHGGRGERVILGDECHIYRYEAGGASALGGLIYHALPTAADGTLDLGALREACAPSDDPHQSPAGLICLENTHNRCGGVVLRPDYLAAAHAIAQERGLPLHLDGARVYNAAVALDVPLSEITRHFHTVSVCLSKGLGAPVGSVLVGSKTAMSQAHRYRKMMGGGMRQAGVLAAAGLIALRDGPAKLKEDHRRARALAEALVDAGYNVNLDAVQTNIIFATIPNAEAKTKVWAESGLLANALGPDSVRFVLHHQITDEALARAKRVLAGG